MNDNLKKLFDYMYSTPMAWLVPDEYYDRPAKLLTLFKKWNITSIFDAGCGERHWMQHNQFEQNNIQYSCGDISTATVNYCKETWPNLDVCLHDLTTDPFPEVDLLFSSDVVIHLNNRDKLNFLNNFLNSNIEYLLITDNTGVANLDFEYTDDFPEASVDWLKDPWNFPAEIDYIDDYTYSGKNLKLWSRSQIYSTLRKELS